MNSDIRHTSTAGINPIDQLMKIKSCSCSKCSSITCFTKRQPRQLNTRECTVLQNDSLYDTINMSLSYLKSINDKELVETSTQEHDKDLIDEDETDINKSKIRIKQSQISFKIDSIDNNLSDEIISGNSVNSYDMQASSTTGKLTAQVMNVSYKDFEESINKPETHPTSLPKLSVFEIFEKLKDLYKACSCKVCECIAGKTQINELCKCKPCDCNDCKKSNKNVQITSSGQKVPLSNCLYPRWEGDLCKAIAKYKSKSKCNCMQCECCYCTDRKSEPCSCRPCQCVECKAHQLYKPLSSKTLIVAAVGSNSQAHWCQCSTCSCTNCVATNMVRRREMSTGLNRHQRCHCDACLNEACVPDDNDTCRCERSEKLMKKPIQRNNTDYDIHSAMTTQSISEPNNNRRDMITMFAAISNRYPICHFNNKDCNCDQCECVKCNFTDNPLNSVRSSSTFISNNNMPTINNTVKFKSSFDKKTYIFENDDVNSELATSKTINNKCDCDVCICLNCEKLLIHSKKHGEIKALNRQNRRPSESTDCDKIMTTHTRNISDEVSMGSKCVANNISKFLYPIKMGAKLNAANFGNKTDHSFIKFYNKQFVGDDFEFLSMNSRFLPLCGYKINYPINSSNNEHQLYKKNYEQTEVLKHAQIDDSANSFLSVYMNSGSIQPEPEDRNKSFNESLTNNSEHDFSNYLVQFPKTSIESCFVDTTKLIKETNLKLIEINRIQKQLNDSPNSMDNKHPISIYYDEHVPSRSVQSCNRKRDTLNNDECSFSVEQVSVANQCCILNGKIPNMTFSSSQTDNETITDFKRKYNDYAWFNDYSSKIQDAREITKSRSFQKTQNPAYLNNDVTLDEDYERIQKTLEDFTQQLVQLLAKYENANREFESISKKFQYNTKQTLVNNAKNSAPRFYKNIHKVFKKSDSNDVPRKDGNKNVYTYGMDVQEHAGDIIVKNVEPKQFSKQVKNTYKKPGENSTDLNENCNGSIIFDANLSSPTYSLNSSDTENSETNLMDDIIQHKSNLHPIIETNEPSTDLKDSLVKRRIKGKVTKTHQKMCKRPSIIPNRSKRLVPKNCIYQVAQNKKKRNNLVTPDVSNQLVVDNEVVKESVPAGDDDLSSVINDLPAKIQDSESNARHGQQNVAEAFATTTPQTEAKQVKCAEELKPCPILKRNVCVKADPKSVVNGFGQPLEVGTKGPIKSISWDNDVQHENRALNSCDSMKVRSLSVRRVSDHTVMVKWSAPKIFKNIKGYEDQKPNHDHQTSCRFGPEDQEDQDQTYKMLVDGRPVQKILNASSRVAVVTCLPTSKSMLLTVRTVTRSPCASGHSPSATIVYNPRRKRKQD